MRACLQIALQHLYLVHDDPVLALPWQLGSTLSGGVWSSYLKLLAGLAVANPQVSILLVQRSANSPSLHAALSPWAECGTRFMPDVHSEWPAWPRFLRVTLLRRQTADALPSVLGWTLAAGHSCTRVMFDHLGIYVRSLDFVRLCSGLVIHEHQEALVTDYACLLGDSVFRAASSASQRNRGVDLWRSLVSQSTLSTPTRSLPHVRTYGSLPLNGSTWTRSVRVVGSAAERS